MMRFPQLTSGRLRAAVVGLGLALVVRGLWLASSPKDTPRETLGAFARALETGDRALAVSLFAPAAQADLPTAVPDGIWTPARRFQWQIKSLSQMEEFATARMYIRDAGYFVEPVVELRRADDGRWQITSVSLDRVDPRFADDARRRAEADADALAAELATALRDAPTVLAAEQPADTVTR